MFHLFARMAVGEEEEQLLVDEVANNFLQPLRRNNNDNGGADQNGNNRNNGGEQVRGQHDQQVNGINGGNAANANHVFDAAGVPINLFESVADSHAPLWAPFWERELLATLAGDGWTYREVQIAAIRQMNLENNNINLQMNNATQPAHQDTTVDSTLSNSVLDEAKLMQSLSNEGGPADATADVQVLALVLRDRLVYWIPSVETPTHLVLPLNTQHYEFYSIELEIEKEIKKESTSSWVSF